MKNKVFLIISIVELVLIAVLATLFFSPKEKPQLSQMRYEKQMEFLNENGIEEDEMPFAIKCIAECEKNPYYVPAMSSPQVFPIAEKVRKAVNNYYGISVPDSAFDFAE